MMILGRLRFELGAALAAKALLLLALYVLFFAHDQGAASTAPGVLAHMLGRQER